MFHSVGVSEILPAAIALVLAGLVKGVTGIGYATSAMPLLAIVMGLETALALVVVPAIVSNAAVFAGAGDVIGTFRRFQFFYLGILPGIAGGSMLLLAIDPRVATHALAFSTLAYVMLAVAKPNLFLRRGLERPLALPAGVLNGVLTGLTGSQILPLVPYMLALRLDPNTQVIAINLAVTIASAALGVALSATGLMTAELAILSCAGAVPAMVGTLAGNWVRGFLPVEALRRLTLAMLVVIAVGLSGRAGLETAVGTLCGTVVADQSAEETTAQCLARLDGALSALQFVWEAPVPP